MIAILRRVVLEFWFAFLGATAWTAWLWQSHQKSSAELIGSFAASFFLFSWATGQFFRIQKQNNVEDRFAGIKEDLERLVESLKSQTDRLFHELTGGESYPSCMLVRCDEDSNHLQIHLQNKGDHPLYDIHIRVADIDLMAKISEKKAATIDDFSIANVVTSLDRLDGHHMAKTELTIDLTGRVRPTFNIFMRARNGLFFQQIEFFQHNGAWLHDESVARNDGTQLDSRKMSEEILDSKQNNGG